MGDTRREAHEAIKRLHRNRPEKMARILLTFFEWGPLSVQECTRLLPDLRPSYIAPRCTELKDWNCLWPTSMRSMNDTGLTAQKLTVSHHCRDILAQGLELASNDQDLIDVAKALIRDGELEFERNERIRVQGLTEQMKRSPMP